MTVFGQVLTPLFLITYSWLRGLILYKPLDSSWRHSSWGMSLLCSPLCWLRIKATFPFPPSSVSVLFNWLWWTKQAKILASSTLSSNQGYELVLSLEITFQLLPMHTFARAQNPLLLSTARQQFGPLKKEMIISIYFPFHPLKISTGVFNFL